MLIRNKAIRKIEAKRLYLLGYEIYEIVSRIGGSIAEIDKWRHQEGWDDEKKLTEEDMKKQRRSLLSHINKLIANADNPAVLAKIIAASSRLPMSSIEQIAHQIINHLIKGDTYA